MGCQSQRREGSVRKCLKRGTTYKKRQSTGTIDGSAAAVCTVCVARLKNKCYGRVVMRVPKRPHHAACPKNRKTRGKSAQTVFVDKEAANNYGTNRAAVVVRAQPPNFEFFAKKISARRMERVSDLPAPMKDFANPGRLRKELDARMKLLLSGDDFSWVENQNYPAATGLLIDYVSQQLIHRKPADTSSKTAETERNSAATERYRHFFRPGELEFKFAPEVNEHQASPFYHAVEGASFFLVDWKRAFPECDVLCCLCKGPLHHDRTNFSDGKKLFPLWKSNGRPSECIVMNYDCKRCNVRFAGNDGRLLSMLPPDIAAAYPVDPRYATGPFHFHRDFTDDLENYLETYCNGGVISDGLAVKMAKLYERKVLTYLSRSVDRDFLSEADFHGKRSPPTGKVIWSLFKDAEESPLQPYGYSNFSRHEREIQSVDVGPEDNVAFDHTFAPTKNIYGLPDAKANFDGIKGSTKEIVGVWTVPSTKIANASHGLRECVEKRRQFCPATVYTDTMPHNIDFWQQLFGSGVDCKLGLFHLLHRIIETMDPHSLLYWEALDELRQCIYYYNGEDLAGLLKALLEGTFNGEKYTHQQIHNIRLSKRWKQRYAEFLRKIIKAAVEADHALDLWILKYNNAKDLNGRAVFTRNTEKVTREQMTKVKYVCDNPDIDYYQKIPAGPRTTHGLPKWRSNRSESALEKAHEAQAHYGNTGMKPELFDVITLRGVARTNVRRRWTHNCEESRRSGGNHQKYNSKPSHYDHSLLHHLNECAKEKGLSPIFEAVRDLPEDNGEVFLTKYLLQEMARLKKAATANTASAPSRKPTKYCKCVPCTAFYLPAQQIPQILPPPAPPPPARPPTTMPPPRHPPRPAPPLVAQRHNQFIFTANRQRPNDACYLIGHKHYCNTFGQYVHDKIQGKARRGKPPHDQNCPRRLGFTHIYSNCPY
jgi:hypothetical protein